MALYVPRPRVRLKDWCQWTGQPWPKVEKVVGDSFRVRAAYESVYTMAANAVLRLIERYQINPQSVGCVALGTESSTDNSAGAVIVKGMVDEALERMGRPALATECEVPEFKHACLGGMYALKSALRFVDAEGPERVAIVVAADIAEYERGSSGEQTQGAGAVAMLVETNPQLLEVDLRQTGSAATYRAIDFRKPVARHIMDATVHGIDNGWHDFPVFNGRYSTNCYMRTVSDAFDAMAARRGESADSYLEDVAAILMHRPYEYMPVQALSMIALRRVLRTEGGPQRLRDLAHPVAADLDKVMAEMTDPPDLFELVRKDGIDADPHPETSKVLRQFRNSPGFKKLVEDKMFLGSGLMRHLGNLYAAALPAWLGAALEEANVRQVRLAERQLLAIGYGSGDAAEAWPLRVVKNWREAAAKLKFEEALAGAVDLDQSAYEAAHDGGGVPDIEPQGEFVVERIGDRTEPSFQDVGIEYYRYVA